MIIGEPTPEFEHYFDRMMQLQQAGFDALRPGRTLAEAETEVSAAFADLGVAEFQRHHTGHGIGLEGHEWPFIDKGSDDVIEENDGSHCRARDLRVRSGGVPSFRHRGGPR